MGKEILAFGDNETEKKIFYHNKIPIPLRNVELRKH